MFICEKLGDAYAVVIVKEGRTMCGLGGTGKDSYLVEGGVEVGSCDGHFGVLFGMISRILTCGEGRKKSNSGIGGERMVIGLMDCVGFAGRILRIYWR